MTANHLWWIVIGAVVSFLVSFIFGDLLALPLDLYYLIYFAIITGLFIIYAKRTELNLKQTIRRRATWGVILGLIFAVIMIMNVLSRPETAHLTGGYLVWSVLWRGFIYGAIDGLLLTVFPWLVIWKAFNGEAKPLGQKIGVGLLSLLFVLVMTTSYHLGYSDFRSPKVMQANFGNTLMSVPTLVTANPLASPITHAALHISAVIHLPETELFLPPHREKQTTE